MITANFFAALVPASVILGVILVRAGKQHLPLIPLWLTFICGFFLIFPTWLVSRALQYPLPYFHGIRPIWRRLYEAFVIAGLSEEGAKLFLLLILIKWIPAFAGEWKMEWKITALTGLGFSFSETMLYSFQSSGIVILRNLTAVPLHILSAIIIGRFLVRSGSRPYRLNGFLIAWLLHGIYDFIIYADVEYFVLVPLLLVISAVLIRRMANNAE